MTLQRIDSDDLASTATFLRDEEKRRSHQSASLYSDISDDDVDNEDDDVDDFGAEEPENEDIAKFLGVTKSSPDVQKAFKSLGIASKVTNHRSTPNRVTPSRVTPVKRERVSKASSKNPQLNGATPKVRLTYETGTVCWLVINLC